MKRQNRAGWALTALAAAGVMFIDAVAYGSDRGYHLGTALGFGFMFVGIAAGLFAWNVATYKK